MGRKSYDEVARALKICATQVTPSICAKCPYGGECVGDNIPLLEDVREMLGDLSQMAALAALRTAQISDFIQAGTIPCFIIINKSRNRRKEWRVITGRFRPSDLDKLGKTVFLGKADAFRELRRLQHGHR